MVLILQIAVGAFIAVLATDLVMVFGSRVFERRARARQLKALEQFKTKYATELSRAKEGASKDDLVSALKSLGVGTPSRPDAR
jgi:hypothetical protein